MRPADILPAVGNKGKMPSPRVERRVSSERQVLMPSCVFECFSGGSSSYFSHNRRARGPRRLGLRAQASRAKSRDLPEHRVDTVAGVRSQPSRAEPLVQPRDLAFRAARLGVGASGSLGADGSRAQAKDPAPPDSPPFLLPKEARGRGQEKRCTPAGALLPSWRGPMVNSEW